ncbi:helix-turn-helix domain-containing protein [Nesterenkonia sp. E16_7]|nr:helix-turn-helix domain-containing protein [Nesterenkonia sp. E16_10]MBO0597088.1 helix-turn-helix domain-containing protein [Nesterenkonia sp. E16_7]
MPEISVPTRSCPSPLPTAEVHLARTTGRDIRTLPAWLRGVAGSPDGRLEYPKVHVDEDVLYVEDGNIITSAGTAASINACLYLIREEFGAKAATAIARTMVVSTHRDGGQAQYIDRPVAIRTGDPMEELLVWLTENLDQQFSVTELAQRMHLSDRTFARRFRAATGTTPTSWINSQRILRAQTLLEDSQLSIDEIARETGFGHAVLLRHHFHRTLGTSPASYRQAFRGRVLSP